MATNDYINTLLQLDTSSLQFPEQLDGVLRGQDFGRSIESLEPEDARRVVECLDKALDRLPLTSDIFKRIHGKLQRFCTHWMLLPSSHELLSGLTVDEHPFTSGGFSDVYKGIYHNSQVCVKVLRVASDSDSKRAAKVLCRQTLIWKRLTHRNIVPFIGATVNPLRIVSEWMPGGDLTTYINTKPRTNQVALLVDTAGGLEYLHSLGVIHGDLKGPNILVDASDHARITDFDLAQHISGEVQKAEGQSARWTAPEVLAEKSTLTTEADVFSFAMVMIEVFTGKVPFNSDKSVPAMVAIMNGERPPRPSHPTLTNGLWELMQKCWAQDVRERPQMTKVLTDLDTFHLQKPPRAPTQLGDSYGPDYNDAPPQPEPPSQSPPVISGTPSPALNVRQQSKEYEPPSEALYSSKSAPPDETSDFDSSDEECQTILRELLNHPNLKHHTRGPRKKFLRGFVEASDEALGRIPVTDALFQTALHKLQSVCSKNQILPSSCLIPGGKVSNSGEQPTAECPAKVRKAKFEGRKVRIRALGPRAQDTSGVMSERKFYGELVMWKRLQHPNIVPVRGVTTEIPQSFEIVCDWMVNGNITEYVRKNSKAKPIELLWDVADGIHYLHSCEIIHGDLKAANILIDKDGYACLTDFGLASMIRRNEPAEIPNGGTVTKEMDIFRFAMVAVETFARCPFKHYQTAINDALAGKYPERPKEMQSHDKLWELLQRCWNKDPGKRPTASELPHFFRQSYPGIKRETPEVQPFSSASFSDLGGIDEGADPDTPPGDPQKAERKRWRRRAKNTGSVVLRGLGHVIPGGARIKGGLRKDDRGQAPQRA